MMSEQSQALTSADVTATIGFMLTLVGLIGTFFYVHLSNWLREILELKAKYQLNAVGENDVRVQGRLECKFQLRRLFNHIPALVAMVISGFILFVLGVATRLVAAVQPEPPVIPYYRTAAKGFLCVYFVLTLYLLLYGYVEDT
jgi:hypothetical protein